jgi:hypothetical protein
MSDGRIPHLGTLRPAIALLAPYADERRWLEPGA